MRKVIATIRKGVGSVFPTSRFLTYYNIELTIDDIRKIFYQIDDNTKTKLLNEIKKEDEHGTQSKIHR